jgi:D-arabinose 1-dehydrogenase-like Zn-dependent alcohol dehydrogenase
MNTMKAAVVPAPGAALEIREIPIPTPGPGEHLADVFALHAAGRTYVAETRKLDEINTIFADVLAGRVPARVALEF